MDSNALRLGLMGAALLGLLACGGRDSSSRDGGPIIMLMDGGGTGTDSGTGGGTDSGTMRTDSGSMSGSVCGSVAGASGFPALPTGCVPRCTSATLMRIMMCPMGDEMCFDSAVMSDTTPSANVDIGMGMTLEVDCEGCLNWQVNSCIYDSCPSQFADYAMCAGSASNPETECATQIMAVNACIMTNMMAIQTCYGRRGGMCFPASGGLLPGASPALPPLPRELIEASLRAYPMRF